MHLSKILYWPHFSLLWSSTSVKNKLQQYFKESEEDNKKSQGTLPFLKAYHTHKLINIFLESYATETIVKIGNDHLDFNNLFSKYSLSDKEK